MSQQSFLTLTFPLLLTAGANWGQPIIQGPFRFLSLHLIIWDTSRGSPDHTQHSITVREGFCGGYLLAGTLGPTWVLCAKSSNQGFQFFSGNMQKFGEAGPAG
ncbi:hypothetical protein GOODEAATRI_032628 [Goodea atripinnis]|uniref:Uncharacterized protein n=1 Tax=Goodea atripinnis TaxID=208336 RepID=A0ABV0MX07_9TELE